MSTSRGHRQRRDEKMRARIYLHACVIEHIQLVAGELMWYGWKPDIAFLQLMATARRMLESGNSVRFHDIFPDAVPGYMSADQCAAQPEGEIAAIKPEAVFPSEIMVPKYPRGALCQYDWMAETLLEELEARFPMRSTPRFPGRDGRVIALEWMVPRTYEASWDGSRYNAMIPDVEGIVASAPTLEELATQVEKVQYEYLSKISRWLAPHAHD